ncbi:MAG: hypothetical protein CM15mP95_3500 [Alphaproteobacteria bacterium]|nr:MAG: hypothetical protein CM15mP95_3500 [Alphaproteobacteria bacterium]
MVILARVFSIAEQAKFFNKHIEPWAGLLMRDIEAAKTVVFYRASRNHWKSIFRN